MFFYYFTNQYLEYEIKNELLKTRNLLTYLNLLMNMHFENVENIITTKGLINQNLKF